jgi:hypothetical protein
MPADAMVAQTWRQFVPCPHCEALVLPGEQTKGEAVWLTPVFGHAHVCQHTSAEEG